MGQAIRIALILVAVVAIIALLTPILDQLILGIGQVANVLPSLISSLSPYLVFGRKMLNALVGFPVIVDIMLWFALISEIALHTVGFVSKIFRKIVG